MLNRGKAILNLKNVSVTFGSDAEQAIAVDNVSLSLRGGSILGVLGESGSGKSQLFKSICRMSSGRISGAVEFDGQSLLDLGEHALNDVRGRKIAYIFQDPMTALNPYLRIRTQLVEVAIRHLDSTRAEAVERALNLLKRVHIPDPERCIASYPHELSGGMRQRVVIAMALMADPKVLIADEPTTALDATVQIQILKLLKELSDDMGIAVVLISHDIGVVASICDEVLVMYAGRVAERADIRQLLSAPRHPYTVRLIESTPDITHPKSELLSGIPGRLPGTDAPRTQCMFSERCTHKQDLCVNQAPSVTECGSGEVACHFPLEAA